MSGYEVPYLHNGQPHDYTPDFLIRLKTQTNVHLILETKGFDPLTDIKVNAAKRWVDAVNADGAYGRWQYAIARKLDEVSRLVTMAAASARPTP